MAKLRFTKTIVELGKLTGKPSGLKITTLIPGYGRQNWIYFNSIRHERSAHSRGLVAGTDLLRGPVP